MNRILIIEDDVTFRTMLKTFLNKMGYNPEVAGTGKDGLKLLQKEKFHLALIDFRLPDTTGLELLQKIKNIPCDIPLVLMTSYIDIKTAVNAIKSGAYDYVTKPINTDEILLTIKSALANYHNKASKSVESATHFLKGESEAAKKINDYINVVAPTPLSVIVQGESGTGKEYVSRLVHERSKRSQGPFVAIDCGALSKELAASELFGHVKGAFTGSLQDKVGQFEYASGGTLFLDEIGNLTYDVQVKLLRAIQERKIRRVGGIHDIEVDVRIIVATNEDLTDFVRKGNFREDLYHRLNEFKITIPPLRERKKDIPLYSHHFLNLSNKELEKSVQGVEEEVMEVFLSYPWPGNIRELKNVIRRAVLLTASGEKINFASLPEEIVHKETFSTLTTTSDNEYDLKYISEKNEKEIIKATLVKVNFNKSKAAKLLNIDRKTLYNKLKIYGLE